MMSDTLLGLCIGVGLAAACGFRVFVPLLVMGLAHQSGHLQLANNFAWMGTWPAITAFGAATALEVAAYYVPWVDNALDSIATPAAGIAGTIAAASMITGLDPMLQWSLGLIAGGGSAMTVQAMTVGTRALSTLTTGGVGNPVVSTFEGVASAGLSVLAIAIPVLALLFVGLIVLMLGRLLLRVRGRGHTSLAIPSHAQVQTTA